MLHFCIFTDAGGHVVGLQVRMYVCVCVYLKRIDHSDRDLIKEDHDSYFIVFTDAH